MIRKLVFLAFVLCCTSFCEADYETMSASPTGAPWKAIAGTECLCVTREFLHSMEERLEKLELIKTGTKSCQGPASAKDTVFGSRVLDATDPLNLKQIQDAVISYQDCLVRTNADGAYTMTLPRGDYQVTVEKSGFKSTFINVSLKDQNEQPQDIPLAPVSDARSRLMVVARNALDKSILTGTVTAKIRSGINNKTDNAIKTVAADKAPIVMDDVAAGTYTLELTKDGFYSAYKTICIIGGVVTSIKDGFVMSPKFTGDTRAFRAILTWGKLPEDLDAHMLIPGSADVSQHQSEDEKAQAKADQNVHWSNTGKAEAPYYTILDVDDLDSWGPETMTVYKIHESGEYHYYVANFSESPAIQTSLAKVEIYTADGLVALFRVPQEGTGLYWDVFRLDGKTMKMTEINQIVEKEPALIN